jgi:Recombinase
MSATRLTETQWMVLSAASQRDDHCAMLPPRLRGGAAQKVVQKLLDLGLVEAVRARGDLPVWRREDDGGPPWRCASQAAVRTNSGPPWRVGAEPARPRSEARGWCEDGRESLLPPRQGSPQRAVQSGGNRRTSSFRCPRWLQAGPGHLHASAPRGRIRDKIAASKRKGLWVGGMVPLGYDSRDRRLAIHEEEAERVRTIFKRYLELGSIGRLLADLRGRGIVTKVRRLANGHTIGGIPFTRGPLAHLLRNRFYIGEVAYKGKICPGEQPPILDRDLFEAVQAKLSEQAHPITQPGGAPSPCCWAAFSTTAATA